MLLRCVSRAAFAALVVPLFLAVPLRAGEPEAIARKLYERVAEGDLDGLHALLADGVSIPPRLALFPRVEAVRCVSLSELRVGDVRHIGDRVEVPVTAGFAKFDPVTGRQPVDVEHAILGMKPAGNGWKLDSWTFEEDL